MDSTLKAPLGGGLVLSRVIHTNGDITLSVTAADGSERFSEALARDEYDSGQREPADPEQGMS